MTAAGQSRALAVVDPNNPPPLRQVDGQTVYSLPGILSLTGATYRQLDSWIRSGRLPRRLPGQGYHRDYTQNDVDTCRYVLALLRCGVTLDAAFNTAHALIDTGEARHRDPVITLHVTPTKEQQ